MVHVLFGFIGVVPLGLGVEMPARRVEVDGRHLGSHDALERVHGGAGPQSVHRIRPGGSIAQTDRVVIAIGETEAHEKAARRLRPQRVDQLLPKQSHSRRAEDDDPLLVEPDDAFVRTEFEQFGQLQRSVAHRPTILPPSGCVQSGSASWIISGGPSRGRRIAACRIGMTVLYSRCRRRDRDPVTLVYPAVRVWRAEPPQLAASQSFDDM